MKTHILFACPQTQPLAEKICAANEDIELGKISWKRFPDTYPDIFIGGRDGLGKQHVSFLACFDSPFTIFEQISAIYTLAAYRPASLKILLPYFPTGTMERVDHEGQVATAHTLAQMLSAVPPSGPGPVPLYIWDIHALQIRHYFGPNICPMFKTGTKLLKEAIEGKDISIIFPDDGAYKRFKVMFSDAETGKPLFPFVICRKVRSGDSRVVTIGEGEAVGRDVVIVDDLIHSGGTTIECMKALKAVGAKSVSAFVTHGVMENECWKKFVDAGFDKVWITDSCPATAAAVQGIGQFEVLSLARSITNAILD